MYADRVWLGESFLSGWYICSYVSAIDQHVLFEVYIIEILYSLLLLYTNCNIFAHSPGYCHVS